MPSQAVVSGLRCEHLEAPLGLDVTTPRLSWRIDSDARDVRQTSYRIECHNGVDTGEVESAQSSLVPYPGPQPKSREQVRWRVHVRLTDGTVATSDWSSWEMGLLEQTDWQAQWVTGPADAFERPDHRPCPLVRNEFEVAEIDGPARLYISALGLYRIWLNGQEVTGDRFAPGYTEYDQRVPYRTYDVTALLRPGANAIGMMLGDGWWCGSAPYSTTIRRRPGPPQGLAQLELGGRVVTATGPSWRVATGSVLASDRYRGERHDARLEPAGWTQPGFDDGGWTPAVAGSGPAANGRLIGAVWPAVRAVEEISPVATTTPMLPGGATVYDFGANIVGWTRLRVDQPPGLQLQVRHGEMLDANGALYVNNLWDATAQTDVHITAGGPETYEPSFTIHGFRYAELAGHVGPVPADAVTAVVAHSDLPRVGSFTCSSDMLNRLHEAVVRTQEGNFVEVPTDCPQRPERLGWLGDAQLFAPTAVMTYDVAAFFTKWIDDILLAQNPEGAFPNVVPLEPPFNVPGVGAPGWGDAGVLLPWLMYVEYADIGLLERCLPAMSRWVEFLAARSRDGVYDPDHAWGDWLAVPPDQYEATRKEVLGTLFTLHSARVVSRAADVLGDGARAEFCANIADAAADGFVRAFVDVDSRISGDTQTLYALALRFGALPFDLAKRAIEHLVDDIEARDGHLSTGIVGTAHVLHALTDHGRSDIAYRVVEQKTYPSWGFALANGATTIWERWDGWTPQHGFQTPAMNSFNHYALGSVGSWLYRSVAGINPDESKPGYEHIVFRPTPGGTLTHASAQRETARGRIASGWRVEGDRLEVEVTVPANSTGTVELPDGTRHDVGSGTWRFEARR